MFSTTETCGTIIVFSIVYSLYVAYERLYLSHLSSVPGPKLAALTYWYEFYYDVVLNGRFVFKIQELHKIYGPIVRVTPTEVHINDVEFLDEIYGTGQRRRNKDASNAEGLGIDLSVAGVSDYDIHRIRRRSLEPFYSVKNVREQESMIDAKVQQVCRHFDEARLSGNNLNLYDVFYGYMRDIIERIAFGEDQNVLGDLATSARLRRNLHELLLGIHVNRFFPWISKIISSLPSAISKPLTPPGIIDLIEFAQHTQHMIKESTLGDASKAKDSGKSRGILHFLQNTDALPPHEKSPLRIQHEVTLMLMAGVESPAGVATRAFYYILANPPVLAKLRAELQTVPQPFQLSALEQLPYLTGVINEANRLNFGVSARLIRIAPDEALEYRSAFDGRAYAIPPNTRVSTSTLGVHTDESVYRDPWSFIPERWEGGEEAARCRKYHMAFGRGPTKCIGMNLAHAELRIVIANVLAKYELELYETDIDDVTFKGDFQVAFPGPERRGADNGVKVVVKDCIGSQD